MQMTRMATCSYTVVQSPRGEGGPVISVVQSPRGEGGPVNTCSQECNIGGRKPNGTKPNPKHCIQP